MELEPMVWPLEELLQRERHFLLKLLLLLQHLLMQQYKV